MSARHAGRLVRSDRSTSRSTDRARYVVRTLVASIVVLVSAAPFWAIGQSKGNRPQPRAELPKYKPSDIKGVFFDDIFDGKTLVGERPANLAAAPAGGGGKASSGGSAPAAVAGGGGGGGAWAKLIDANIIEDEIKATKQLVDMTVTTPTDFAGKGYKEARRNFTVVAMLFGVITEYDGDVRWKSDAPAARDQFARTAANAKVGTQQVYNEAKLRKQDLEDILGGGGLANKTAAEGKVTWNQICDRSPLMQRLEQAIEPRIQQWTANKTEFNSKKAEILHEAQVVAVIGQVMLQEGMPDADGDEYKVFCDALRKGAMDVVDAVKLGDDEKARQAVGAINKSCTDCHENYRS